MLDGTVAAQKALSAVARSKEMIGISILVDILRGARTQPIISKGYDKMKTFGKGQDLKPLEWREYLHQMINTGVLDVAYDENHHLKLNDRSRRVLFEGEQVLLSVPQVHHKVEKTRKAKSKSPDIPLDEDQLLFEHLRRLRKDIADADGLPPYVIFHDSVLHAMARVKPGNQSQMLDISGIGENKYNRYGQRFLKSIAEFTSK
jgi:ATP-dependent DNA helicase RecQ